MINAIIPVRSGSLRVENKNLRPFAGKSLLEIKITQLLQVPEISQVFVSSNDNQMLKIAEELGAKPVLRDEKYATNTIPMSEVYANMVSTLPDGDVCYATVTTPFIGAKEISAIIQAYASNKALHDSIHTVVSVRDFMLLKGKPLNYDAAVFPRSQDLPDIRNLYLELLCLTAKLMITRRSSLGFSPLLYDVTQEQAIDIDTPHDFEVAEYLYRKQALLSDS